MAGQFIPKGKKASLGSMIADRGFVLLPSIYSGLTAKICERAGFNAVYVSGAATSINAGMPDVGLLTVSEMLVNIRQIAAAVSVPIVADADTGYGNPLNVRRTVRDYEAAGVDGLHIEDQVFPKKCGFYRGKAVVSTEEHAFRIAAACEARTRTDTLIIARTDALQTAGWDDVEMRVRTYREAGADVVFVDGVRSYDVKEYVRRVVRQGIPALYNGTDLSAAEAQDAGFVLQIQSVALYASYPAEYGALTTLARTGRKPGGSSDHGQIPPITDIVGLPEIYELEARYGVAAEPSAEDAEWERAFALLKEYVTASGTSNIEADAVFGEFELGAWVRGQREIARELGGRQAVLTAERRKRLESLPSWTWQ